MKNPEDFPEGNSLVYLYGEILSDKVNVIGCVACRSSNPSTKKGFPAIPEWKNERSELSCLVPNGRYVSLILLYRRECFTGN